MIAIKRKCVCGAIIEWSSEGIDRATPPPIREFEKEHADCGRLESINANLVNALKEIIDTGVTPAGEDVYEMWDIAADAIEMAEEAKNDKV